MTEFKTIRAGNVYIDEIIRIRLAYIKDEHPELSKQQEEQIRSQLEVYLRKHLDESLVVFAAEDHNRLVASAFLLIVEMPANPALESGRYGVVLNVYTEPQYRRKGISTALMQNLISFAKEKQLGRIDLSATEDGFPLYKKLGFQERKTDYTEMRMILSKDSAQ